MYSLSLFLEITQKQIWDILFQFVPSISMVFFSLSAVLRISSFGNYNL